MSSSNAQERLCVALKKISEKFEKLERGLETRDDEEFQDSAPKVLKKLLMDTCAVVRKARSDASIDLPTILALADELLNEMINCAYGEHELCDFLPSFAHDGNSSPLIEDPSAGGIGGIGAGALESLLPILRRNNAPDLSELLNDSAIAPYDPAKKPHKRTTPLARFRKYDTSQVTNINPLAQAVYQARCSVTSTRICSPIRFSLSSSSSCLALAAAGSWKNRSPVLSFYLLDQPLSYDDFPEHVVVDVGLSDVAYDVATDDQRKLIYTADEDRIKSYMYGVDGEDCKWLPKHTLKSQKRGPLALVNNGSQMLRAGKGGVDVWDVDSLPDHGDDGKKKIGKGRISTEDSSRDEDEEIECSPGSKPNSTLNFSDSSLDLASWKPFPMHSSSKMLCAPKEAYSCLSIDLQAGGQIAARFLGHGGQVNSFSTSEGDANGFITSCNDGFVRLFDVREPLPCLSFDAGGQSEFIQSSLLIHVHGISLVISGGQRSEQIKIWDPRGRALLYELATGNNGVGSLAWDGPRSTLYAATECKYMDRLGYHHDYRQARIRTDDYDEDEGDPEEYDEERWWPRRAYHNETQFGYAFDSGEHRLFRYAFGVDADPKVLPVYGDARPSTGMW